MAVAESLTSHTHKHFANKERQRTPPPSPPTRPRKNSLEETKKTKMGSIADLVAALPSEDTWGPSTSTDNMLQGVPYAPFSKGDKLGRMADWTAESKDRERGRPAYNRNFRGVFSCLPYCVCVC